MLPPSSSSRAGPKRGHVTLQDAPGPSSAEAQLKSLLIDAVGRWCSPHPEEAGPEP